MMWTERLRLQQCTRTFLWTSWWLHLKHTCGSDFTHGPSGFKTFTQPYKWTKCKEVSVWLWRCCRESIMWISTAEVTTQACQDQQKENPSPLCLSLCFSRPLPLKVTGPGLAESLSEPPCFCDGAWLPLSCTSVNSLTALFPFIFKPLDHPTLPSYITQQPRTTKGNILLK